MPCRLDTILTFHAGKISNVRKSRFGAKMRCAASLPQTIISPMQQITADITDLFERRSAVRPLLMPSRLRETFKTLLLIASIYCFANLTTARFVVEGASMAPNFHTNQLIIVSRLAYLLGSPERG